MTKHAWAALLSVTILAEACGGGSGGSGGGGGARDTVTGVSVGSAQATFHSGGLPSPHGTLTVTAPGTTMAVNGGSTMVELSTPGNVVTVYVSVQGQDGYWQVMVPAGTPAVDVLLTLAQTLMAGDVPIVFEVGDASGNVSAPVVVPTTILVVGTGDVAVSLAWDQGIDNDLDLHVVDPNHFEVYYAEQLSPEGGELDLDSNAGCSTDGVNNEHIVWPTGMAPHGTYIVRVDNYDNCTSMAVHYVVTVQRTGKAAETFTGSFTAADAGDHGGLGDGVQITTFTY